MKSRGQYHALVAVLPRDKPKYPVHRRLGRGSRVTQYDTKKRTFVAVV